ncbi:hypothetical protein [Nitrospira sp. Kam-Ns4a]
MLSALLDTLRDLRSVWGTPADPSESLLPLQQRPSSLVDFDGFKKGIDNVHIDVRLSPQFVRQARRLIASLLEQQVGQDGWGQKGAGPSRSDWETFRTTYAQMVEGAIHRAKLLGQPALVALVQLGAMKFLLRQVQGELDHLRQSLRAALGSAGETSDADRIQLNERMGWLVRNRARLRYRLSHQVIEQVYKAESGSVAELRQSLLGERWPLPEEVLFNPLLRAENPLDDEILMKHYVWLGQGMDDLYSFSALDGALPYLFRRREPVSEAEQVLTQAEQRHQQLVLELERLRGKRSGTKSTDRRTELETRIAAAQAELERARAAYVRAHAAWLDVPANADLLFNADHYAGLAKKAEEQGDRAGAARLRAQVRFQRRLLATLERRFRERGWLGSVLASYEMVPLFRDCAALFTAQQLHQILSGVVGKKELLFKLKEKPRGGLAVPTEPLLAAARRAQAPSRRQRRAALLRFMTDFLTLRRDLGAYHQVHHLMNQIALQEDPQHIRLSRTNHTLYEFLVSTEEEIVAQTVLNHVILKADVRGSTTMVAELRKRGLNPASHFSLNFFGPLNDLLETYGASKVFIEGDAVILSILEYQETLEHQFSVARACGLAKRLLGMVQAQNAVCKKEGLPELELGIGLVFNEEAPTFLYDGNAQIMISPAIGKADRLSSCSWMLRKERGLRIHPSLAYANVDLYELPEGDPLRGEKGEIHLLYNLNGIMLDEAAFAKLKTEITLRRLELRLPGDAGLLTVHTGRFPDLKGGMHRVVVREGRIRVFDRSHKLFGEPTQGVFYEVVTNETVLAKVAEALKETVGEG